MLIKKSTTFKNMPLIDDLVLFHEIECLL